MIFRWQLQVFITVQLIRNQTLFAVSFAIKNWMVGNQQTIPGEFLYYNVFWESCYIVSFTYSFVIIFRSFLLLSYILLT